MDFYFDADERITAGLAKKFAHDFSIRNTMATGSIASTISWAIRSAMGLGETIAACGSFAAMLGRYVGPTDHAEVKLSSGTVGRLLERLVHYTCTSYSQYLPKLSRYADVQARLWKEEGRRPKLRQLLFRFPMRFVQGYVLRLGFLDGLAGLHGGAGGVRVLVETSLPMAAAIESRDARYR